MVGPVRLDQDLRNLPYVAPKQEFEERRLTRYPLRGTGQASAPSGYGTRRPEVCPGIAQKSLAPDPDDAGATVHI